jgi:hypothetical protein
MAEQFFNIFTSKSKELRHTIQNNMTNEEKANKL